MRARLLVLVWFTVASVGRIALADDAGDDGGAADDASTSYVIACDGGLCDTLQGRPTCSVSPRSIGHPCPGSALWGALSGVVLVLAGQRARRGRLGRIASDPIEDRSRSPHWEAP
jgi:hypothetical protein